MKRIIVNVFLAAGIHRAFIFYNEVRAGAGNLFLFNKRIYAFLFLNMVLSRIGARAAALSASTSGRCVSSSSRGARAAATPTQGVIISAARNTHVRRFGVKQNYYIEKWNGVRENTTKEFSVNSGNFATVFLAAVGFPLAYYGMYKSEEAGRNGLARPRTFNQEKIKTM